MQGAPHPEWGERIHARMFFNWATPLGYDEIHPLYALGLKRYRELKDSFGLAEEIEFRECFRSGDGTILSTFYRDRFEELIRAAQSK